MVDDVLASSLLLIRCLLLLNLLSSSNAAPTPPLPPTSPSDIARAPPNSVEPVENGVLAMGVGKEMLGLSKDVTGLCSQGATLEMPCMVDRDGTRGVVLEGATCCSTSLSCCCGDWCQTGVWLPLSGREW